MRTLLILLVMIFKASADPIALELNILQLDSDNGFRTDEIKAFEEKFISDGWVLETFTEPNKYDSPLIDYYMLVSQRHTDVRNLVANLRALAKVGVVAAKVTAGDLLSNEELGVLDIEAAKQLYQSAFDSGEISAAIKLGNLIWQQTQNFEEAISWLKRGVEKGDASASFNLAQLYLMAKNDLTTALSYYNSAAASGHATANFNLYILHNDPAYGITNKKKALTHLKMAADLEHREAQYFYGMQLFNEKDSEDIALNIMSQAAEADNVDAQAFLGSYYSERIDSQETFDLAVKWYQRAADAGHEAAKHNLKVLFAALENAKE